MAVGYDLRTGEQKKQIVVRGLRSPEHHHRCYRNKATERYMISGMEGAEFWTFPGNDHSQNNWLRGACKLGIMPATGCSTCPPDQCFCQPGASLGFAALAANAFRGSEIAEPGRSGRIRIANPSRLERGPAYGEPLELPYRRPTSGGLAHVPARRGPSWCDHGAVARTGGDRLAANDRRQADPARGGGGRVFVASRDAHTVVCPGRGIGCDPMAVHRRRSNRLAADHPPRPGPVRLSRRADVLPARRRRPAGLAVSGRPHRSAYRGLRPTRIGSGRCTAACWSGTAWPTSRPGDRPTWTAASGCLRWIRRPARCSTRPSWKVPSPTSARTATSPSICSEPIPTCWSAKATFSTCGRRS